LQLPIRLFRSSAKRQWSTATQQPKQFDLSAALALYLMQDLLLLPSTPGTADLRTPIGWGDHVDAWKAQGRYAGSVVKPTEREPRGKFVVDRSKEESAEAKVPLAQVFMRARCRVVITSIWGARERIRGSIREGEFQAWGAITAQLHFYNSIGRLL
jgi:hypothetical protein